MKQVFKLLALAACMPGWAMAEVSVYGKGDVALQHADENGDSKAELVSNNSRLGLKGAETLTEGLEAIYQFEYGTEIDDGEKDDLTLSQRNIYIGLRGAFGSVIAGHMDTPVKKVQGDIDLFNDREGDIGYLFAGEVRASNLVQYRTPTLGPGLSGSLAYITYEQEGLDPGVSASGGFHNDWLYVGVGLETNVQGQDSDVARLGTRLSIASVHIGGLYERYQDNQIDEDGALISVLWEVTEAWDLKAQGGRSDINYNGSDAISLGVDYHLSDRTTVYGYYTSETNDFGVSGVGDEADYLGLGMSLSF